MDDLNIGAGGPDLTVALLALGIDPLDLADTADRDAVTTIAVRRSAAFAESHESPGDGGRARYGGARAGRRFRAAAAVTRSQVRTGYVGSGSAPEVAWQLAAQLRETAPAGLGDGCRRVQHLTERLVLVLDSACDAPQQHRAVADTSPLVPRGGQPAILRAHPGPVIIVNRHVVTVRGLEHMFERVAPFPTDRRPIVVAGTGDRRTPVPTHRVRG